MTTAPNSAPQQQGKTEATEQQQSGDAPSRRQTDKGQQQGQDITPRQITDYASI